MCKVNSRLKETGLAVVETEQNLNRLRKEKGLIDDSYASLKRREQETAKQVLSHVRSQRLLTTFSLRTYSWFGLVLYLTKCRCRCPGYYCTDH